MFPNLPNTNITSETLLKNFTNERTIRDYSNLFTSDKYHSLYKDIPKSALNMDTFIVYHNILPYIYSPNSNYPFLPNVPHYNIFGDWNNMWIKK